MSHNLGYSNEIKEEETRSAAKTKENNLKMYLSTLKKVIKKGGYVIIAAFSLKGAKKCSGLDVKNYDQNMLAKFLGQDFSLLEHFDYTYYMPSGEPRPCIYALFQKQ